jgi:hypothetical protein
MVSEIGKVQPVERHGLALTTLPLASTGNWRAVALRRLHSLRYEWLVYFPNIQLCKLV